MTPTTIATDTEDLTLMLHEFLAEVVAAQAHDRFWAEDLIYTSSRGTRTTKAEIMQGFSTSSDDDKQESEPVYAAKDIQIQVYENTAVVAFQLVATTAKTAPTRTIQNYFNTGTFVKRDGRWQVVAWQATVIPDANDE